MDNNKLGILQFQIDKIDYPAMLDAIEIAFKEEKQITLTGANVHTINLSTKNIKFRKVLNQIDIIHPDGIGVFLASRFLFGKHGFVSRITGSDFYIQLIKYSIENGLSLFFFGDVKETLDQISKKHPGLKIRGLCNGFDFNNEELIKTINSSEPDILIVGLGSPKQEDWIVSNKEKIKTKVIIAVGDGIKVFAGIKKRGPKIIRLIGLEWFARLVYEPKRLWKRYILGNPIFILRLFKYKLFQRLQ